MTERKNFNYKTATVSEIVEQFKKSSRQAISAIRTSWKGKPEMSDKIEQAYRQYRIDKLLAQLDAE